MADILNFHTNIPLEERVKIDMRSMGLDPNNPEHITLFWDDKFEGEPVVSKTEVNGQVFKIIIIPIDNEEGTE